MCAMSFIMYLDRVNLSASAGVIRDDLHLSNTGIGLVFAAFAYTYAICQVLGGWASDRTGSWTLPFAGSIALLGLGIVMTFFMRPDRPLRDDAQAEQAVGVTLELTRPSGH